VKLKNLLDRRQDLDVPFLFKLSEDRSPVRLKIGGLPRGPKGTPEGKGVAGDTFEKVYDQSELTVRPTGVFGVEQVLTWQNAAVRGIDDVSIGTSAPDDFSLSHRMNARTLKPLRPDSPDAAAATAGAPGAPALPGDAPPGPGERGIPGAFGPGGLPLTNLT